MFFCIPLFVFRKGTSANCGNVDGYVSEFSYGRLRRGRFRRAPGYRITLRFNPDLMDGAKHIDTILRTSLTHVVACSTPCFVICRIISLSESTLAALYPCIVYIYIKIQKNIYIYMYFSLSACVLNRLTVCLPPER